MALEAFFNPVLPSDCKVNDKSLSKALQEKAFDLDEVKQTRDLLYNEYVSALHKSWRRANQDCDQGETRKKRKGDDDQQILQGRRRILMESFSTFRKDFSTFEPHFKKEQEPSRFCALYGSFLDLRKLNVQNNQVLDLRIGESQSSYYCGGGKYQNAMCKYLDENYPYDTENVYRFPESYVCHTEQNDRRNISKRLSCSKCLSHYSDQILRELVSLKVDEKDEHVKEYLGRRNGLKAVQYVCQRIELWCRGLNTIHIFIMANVSYKSYLRQYNRDQKPVTASQGDHDILIISEEIGIIFIQVKSCEDRSGETVIEKRIKEALEQLIKDKFVFLESNRDLNFISPELPMWGFVALPYVSEDELLKLPICDSHKKIILNKNAFYGMDWLDGVLQCLRKGGSVNPWTCQQFRLVCARYVGEGKTKGMYHLSNAIEETLAMFGTKIFTPEQNRILEKEDNAFQVITGDFGTGKSLLLCKKICNLSKTMSSSGRGKIYLVTCVGLDKNCRLNTQIRNFPAIRQLAKYIDDIQTQQQRSDGIKWEVNDKLKIMTLGTLFVECFGSQPKSYQNVEQMTPQQFNDLFSHLMYEGVSIFIDEMPLKLFKDCEEFLFSSTSAAKGHCVWVSIATQSCYGKLNHQAITHASSSSSPMFGSQFFHSNFLRENMRNSCSILRLMNAITAYTEESLQDVPDSGHSIDGPLPLVCRIPRCCCQKKVNNNTIFCDCLEDRIKLTLQFVYKIISGTKQSEADVIYMVSHFYNDSFESSIYAKLKGAFDRLFKNLGKQYFWLTLADTESGKRFEGKYDNEELIVDEATFTGSESAVVINIDLLSMWQWLRGNEVGAGSILVMSRCTSQYIHIVLQGNEPELYIKEHIKMFQEQRNKSTDESLQEKCKRAIEIMERCLAEKGQLLKQLLETGVMKEIVCQPSDS